MGPWYHHRGPTAVSQGAQSDANPGIVLVTLDDATTKALDEFAPLTLDYHAKFLESLERLSPKAVGYLVDMNQVTPWRSGVCPVARLLGQAIRSIHEETSVSSLFV